MKRTSTVLYQHAFNGHNSDAILYRVQPNLNAVAVFPINKDLKMVVEDNFQDVRFTPIMQPMWHYLHQRSFTGIHRKLYAYFHDKKVDIFGFEKNRFKFFNSFNADHAKDALYFILYRMEAAGIATRCRMSCMFQAIFRIRIGSSTTPNSMSRRLFS